MPIDEGNWIFRDEYKAPSCRERLWSSHVSHLVALKYAAAESTPIRALGNDSLRSTSRWTKASLWKMVHSSSEVLLVWPTAISVAIKAYMKGMMGA